MHGAPKKAQKSVLRQSRFRPESPQAALGDARNHPLIARIARQISPDFKQIHLPTTIISFSRGRSMFLGIDVGTGGTRAVLVNRSGHVIASCSTEHAPIHSEHI